MAMKTKDGSFVLSPSDLTASAGCEFGWLRSVDIRWGRTKAVEVEPDAMMERAADLGDIHEARELASLKAAGLTVVEIERPKPYTSETLAAAQDKTLEALKSGAEVVFQATFFDGGFGAMSDCIRLDSEGAYAVWDAKLARSAKVTALLQIAAYADQLDRLQIPRSPIGHLLLGNGEDSVHNLDEIMPVYFERRAKLERVLREHLDQPNPVSWNDDRYAFCGTCDHCKAELEAADDVLLVARLTRAQRAKLRVEGIETIKDLAGTAKAGKDVGIPAATFEKLRLQAQLQAESAKDRDIPKYVVTDPDMIRRLPKPSPGDVFFDFEGDPLWWDPSGHEWGLEYLFGVIEPTDAGDGVFRPWWAHNRAEEKGALIGFLDYIRDRRATHPELHIYHYASYEVTALKRLVGQHGALEDFLDQLLREGVFVDLYKTVGQCLRVGVRSYSIKKLEPLYMGADLRTGLDNAADSMVEYARYTAAIEAGHDDLANTVKAGIAEYNKYDCVSTWRLRDWLIDQVGRDDHRGDDPDEPDLPDSDGERVVPEEDRIDALAPIMKPLLDFAGESDGRTNDQQAAAMVAAALSFHRREHKPFWWGFFDRLEGPVDEWIEPRDFLIGDHVELVGGWAKPTPRSLPRRLIELRGFLDPASNLKVDTNVKGIYDDVPLGFELPEGSSRCVGGSAKIVEIVTNNSGEDVVTISESSGRGNAPWDELSMAICISSPIGTKSIEDTLIDLGESVGSALPEWPNSPALDILRRLTPRLTASRLPPIDIDPADAIYDALLMLDRSYLAVQGPPGTGKTYVGSRVIKNLVSIGWRIGVVAQSHATVENFLDAAIDAGVPVSQIAKPNGRENPPWSDLNGAKLRHFIAITPGCLVGGTAWTFSNRNSVELDQLDLIVIDEAGQFSLANTLAVSTAAKRLLLLGDPQQLPQVSQGTHPEPVDVSALEWIIDGHNTMPADRGYFLAHTWRMHSTLTAPVSKLAYEGRLRSNEAVTDSRHLAGVGPGVHAIHIDHAGNSAQSPEEAHAIVGLIRQLIGQTWQGKSDQSPRPLVASDVLVVAPYNAQVALLRRTLDQEGLGDTRVGTVDKFQGQEAPVVIVSMTASGAQDVPRGMEFLLNRNRLNVAISRGQWAAYVVRSTALTDYLPSKPDGLAELGAFIRLNDGTSK